MGQIEVICGSMFSGKSEELIRRLKRARIARQRIQVFKPHIDTRSGDSTVTSHSDMKIQANIVDSSDAILRGVHDRTDIVGINEVQFFDRGVVDVVNKLANLGKRVIVAGLDQDYLGRPFDPMPQLMAIAEYVTKTLAVCSRCGAPANRSQRLATDNGRVMVGAGESYEARCRRCFEPDLSRQIGMDLSASGPEEPEPTLQAEPPVQAEPAARLAEVP